MLAEPEHFKGIVYIRISRLPAAQKQSILQTLSRHSIVTILKEQTIVNDCVIYNEYMAWYRQYHVQDFPQLKAEGIPSYELSKELT